LNIKAHTFKEVNEVFGVDSKWYYSWKKWLEEIASSGYRSPKERRGKLNKNEPLLMLEERPAWYLRKFTEQFNVCL
jgi:hypothetical protein